MTSERSARRSKSRAGPSWSNQMLNRCAFVKTGSSNLFSTTPINKREPRAGQKRREEKPSEEFLQQLVESESEARRDSDFSASTLSGQKCLLDSPCFTLLNIGQLRQVSRIKLTELSQNELSEKHRSQQPVLFADKVRLGSGRREKRKEREKLVV